ncbi:protein FAM76B [Drosophila tropicalis]|uniref:protein FAM76B n=1 Tax=Drosophila tropicalis TaxID=46794 RepID=UPI0035ABDD6C
MEPLDDKWYRCSRCFGRCLWHNLSRQEHRCPQCRLPIRTCAICDKNFEPREKAHYYCKRCDFYLEKQAAVKPPPVEEEAYGEEYSEDNDEEMQTTNKASVMERWQEIKTAAGIVDDFYLSD